MTERSLTAILVGVVLVAGCGPPSAGRPAGPSAARDALSADAVSSWAAILSAEDRRAIDDGLRVAAECEDTRIRARAHRALGRIGDPAADPLVRGGLDDAEPEVRAAATLALARLEPENLAAALDRAASDVAPEVRAAAAAATSLSPAGDADARLLRLLDDEDPAVRFGAATAAASVEIGPDTVAALVRQVDDADVRARWAAVVSLAELARPGSPAGRGLSGFRVRRAARDRLLALADDPHPTIRAQAARGLAVATSREETAALVRLASDRDSAVRIHALRSLGYPGAPVVGLARERFEDEDAAVYAAMLETLGRARTQEAYKQLSIGLTQHRDLDWLDPYFVRAVFDHDPLVGVQSSEAMMNSPTPEARIEVCRGIASVAERAGQRARDLLVRHATEDESRVRAAAVRAYGAMLVPLADLGPDVVSSDDPIVRAALADAAADRLAGEPDPDLRAEAVRMVEIVAAFAADVDRFAVRRAAVEAAGTAPDDPALRAVLAGALRGGPGVIRERAAALLGSDPAPGGGAPGLSEPDPLEIARWAARPRAAIVEVVRPGYPSGRFTVALDTSSAPIATWRFARMAEDGVFDGIAFDGMVPGTRIGVGHADDERFDGLDDVMRTAPFDGEFPAGSIVLEEQAEGVALGPWSVNLTARPDLVGRATRLGRVVQNLDGVVRRLLPGDRIVSMTIYDGDGTEPLPARPENERVEPAAAISRAAPDGSAAPSP